MKAIGYEYLREKLELNGHRVPLFKIETRLIERGRELIEIKDGREVRYIREKRKNPQDDWEHLIFALSNEGINFSLLVPFFKEVGKKKTASFVLSNLSSKYNRIVWFLYEDLLGVKLELEDDSTSRYSELINSKKFYTGTSVKSKRHKILDNRIGHSFLSPIISRGDTNLNSDDLKKKAQLLIDQYSPDLISKSVNFLYSKETKKSNEIEREHPDKKREARFIDLLKQASKLEELGEADFVGLQNSIVDSRYAVKAYRDYQTYIGVTDMFGNETVHYICPKGDDVRPLMVEFEKLCNDIINDSSVDGIVAATTIAFLFVYLHPMLDGNGRIHRFLIHYALSKREVTPKNMIFPVSAVIAANMDKYDRVLENFSESLVPLIDYELDKQGEMTVLDADTKHLYYGIDLTKAFEFLVWTLEETLVNDFENELKYMKTFLASKEEIKSLVDMPDRKLNNLINMVLINSNKLSANKRSSLYSELTDDEVTKIEKIISNNL